MTEIAPRPGERILDLSCGDGALTERLAALGCSVIGVDSAAEMVAAARRRGLECTPRTARISGSRPSSMRCSRMPLCIGCVMPAPRSGSPARAQAQWTVRRRVRQSRQRCGDHGRIGRGPQPARGGWPGRDPLILSKRRGLCGAAWGPWVLRRSDRPDSPADAAADRHGGLARYLRGEHFRPAVPQPARRGARRGARSAEAVPLR